MDRVHGAPYLNLLSMSPCQTSVVPYLQRVRDSTSEHGETPLFAGNAPMGTRAVALFRYCRVMSAIGAYTDSADVEVRINNRMRWTVGMHCELVCSLLFPSVCLVTTCRY